MALCPSTLTVAHGHPREISCIDSMTPEVRVGGPMGAFSQAASATPATNSSPKKESDQVGAAAPAHLPWASQQLKLEPQRLSWRRSPPCHSSLL